MWADFNQEHFPTIIVKLYGSLNKDEEFDNFIKEWLEIVAMKKDFSFIFDTEECETINYKYIVKLAIFIKTLKNMNPNYLQKSILVMNSRTLKMMLKLLFSITSPSAPVHICGDLKEAIKVNHIIDNNQEIPENIRSYYP